MPPCDCGCVGTDYECVGCARWRDGFAAALAMLIPALRKYGGHRVSCHAYRSHETGIVRGGYKDLKDPNSYSTECNCGLDAALSAAADAMEKS